MSTRPVFRSFAGGEIAPELFGRIDLDKYNSGLKTCTNFEVLPHGPVANRAGFDYVIETKDSDRASRLIPFTYSTDQTMVLEFGHEYIRYHTQGATLLESSNAISGVTQASPGVVTSAAHGYANGDWVYIASVGGMTSINGRFYIVAGATTNTFTLQALDGTAINTTTLSAYTSGGTVARVYEIATTYQEDDLFDLHYTQSSDVLTIVHPSYAPAELRRLGATNWELTDIEFGLTVDEPHRPSVTRGGSASTSADDTFHAYLITSVIDGEGESAASGVALAPLTGYANISDVDAGASEITVDASCYFNGGALIRITSVGGITGINNGYYWVKSQTGAGPYVLTLCNEDGSSPTWTGTYTSGGNVRLAGVRNDLTTQGQYNELVWSPETGVSKYNVYKALNGVYGYIGQSSNGIFKDDNIIPDMSKTPPTHSALFSAADDYPSAVGYYEQRRAFGGTNNAPHGVWLTSPGTENSMQVSFPSQDDDAVIFEINARQQNKIRHLVPLSDLIALTPAGAWRIASAGGEAITPATVTTKVATYAGSSNVQPVTTESALLYVQSQGSKVRELFYSWESQNYRAEDITVLAPHLVDNYTIVDLAYSAAPSSILWAVRSDGTLLGLTYLPDQRVRAWHKHTTAGGYFESVCSVGESNQDRLYAIVRRTINGRTVRYIERKAPRSPAVYDWFFVDAGATYDGAATDTITGLHHLEGETVAVLVDGATHPDCVVTNGAITLQVEGELVHVGKRITADIAALPLMVDDRQGFGIGMVKNINKVILRVEQSGSIFAGPNTDNLREYKQRTTETWGTRPDLVSGIVEIPVDGTWTKDGSFVVRHTAPLPLMIVSAVLDVVSGG